MPTVDYTTMSDSAIEAKRNEIQLRIEALRLDFIALGKEKERRRVSGESVKDYPELKAEIAKLQGQLTAQEVGKPWYQRLLGG